jgi:hypothetical protein
MWCWGHFIAVILIASCLIDSVKSLNEEELAAEEFLTSYDKEVGILMNLMTIASWNYETNITDPNEEASLEASAKVK